MEVIDQIGESVSSEADANNDSEAHCRWVIKAWSEQKHYLKKSYDNGVRTICPDCCLLLNT